MNSFLLTRPSKIVRQKIKMKRFGLSQTEEVWKLLKTFNIQFELVKNSF